MRIFWKLRQEHNYTGAKPYNEVKNKNTHDITNVEHL